MARTSLHKKIGGYRRELPHTGDMELWMRIGVHASVGILDAEQAYKRSHGQNMQVAYTVGKAIDYSSSFGLGLGIVDANNLKLNRALADFDIRQKLALSLLYETPRIHGNALFDILSRWQLGAVTILQSGRPFVVNCNTPFSAIRDGTYCET